MTPRKTDSGLRAVPANKTPAARPPAANGHAIEQASAATQQVRMAQLQGHFGTTGRPFQVIIPADLTWQEACALVKAIADLPAQMAAQPKPHIIVPNMVPFPLK